MANYTEAQWNAKKIELMEKCFHGFADLGLLGTGIRTLAKHCGYNTSMIYLFRGPGRPDYPIHRTLHAEGGG